MKPQIAVNFAGELLDLDGSTLTRDEKTFPAHAVACDALRAATPSQRIDAKEHLRRHYLAKRIFESARKNEPAMLDPTELELLRESVAAYWQPLIAGPMLDHLADEEKRAES